VIAGVGGVLYSLWFQVASEHGVGKGNKEEILVVEAVQWKTASRHKASWLTASDLTWPHAQGCAATERRWGSGSWSALVSTAHGEGCMAD
jgi:hypothetical protein